MRTLEKPVDYLLKSLQVRKPIKKNFITLLKSFIYEASSSRCGATSLRGRTLRLGEKTAIAFLNVVKFGYHDIDPTTINFGSPRSCCDVQTQQLKLEGL
jgi:hypothetical protein